MKSDDEMMWGKTINLRKWRAYLLVYTSFQLFLIKKDKKTEGGEGGEGREKEQKNENKNEKKSK